MAKHIHIHVGSKAKDSEWKSALLRKPGSTRRGFWNGSKFVETMENAETKPGYNAERLKSLNAQVEVNGQVVAGERVITKSEDASNHLGEKEYYTFRRWKEAVKAAYPNARFEGDQDMCNAVPGGDWDGEKGVVYAKRTGDARYDERVRAQLQAINQLLTEASRKCAGLSASMPNGDSAISNLEDMIDAARRKCFELR